MNVQVACRVSAYLRHVANMLEIGTMKIEFFNSNNYLNSMEPDNFAALMEGESLGIGHKIAINAWQRKAFDPGLLYGDPLPKLEKL